MAKFGLFPIADAKAIRNRVLGGHVTEFKEFTQPRGGKSGGEAVIGVTRSGGIAARTTTSVPHTFPSATIDLIDPDTGDFYDPNRTEVIYNSTSIAIGASSIIQAKKMLDSERYFVDVDDCVGGGGDVVLDGGAA